MKFRDILGLFILSTVVLAASRSLAADSPAYGVARGRWSEAKANAWLDEHGWLVGCNFAPSTAINQLEMWQADTFDPATIDRELGFAESLGFNSVRVFLHDKLWQQDSKGFLDRIDKFLEIADRHHIGAVLVLFDSCWHPVAELGKQPKPIPFTHNSGWVQSPGAAVLAQPEKYPHLKEYTQGVLRRFAQDRRVHLWDVWNEPECRDSGDPERTKLDVADKSRAVGKVLEQVFRWAREVDPSQPLTACVCWRGQGDNLNPFEKSSIANSDVITFHCYDKTDVLKQAIGTIKRFNRPALCTEFMARTANSTFDPQLAVLKENRIAAYCWGLVLGKTQTIYPWESWKNKFTAEPPVWFHDIFRADGTPFSEKEVAYIRSVTGRK